MELTDRSETISESYALSLRMDIFDASERPSSDVKAIGTMVVRLYPLYLVDLVHEEATKWNGSLLLAVCVRLLRPGVFMRVLPTLWSLSTSKVRILRQFTLLPLWTITYFNCLITCTHSFLANFRQSVRPFSGSAP
jgi:hypothetical protein